MQYEFFWTPKKKSAKKVSFLTSNDRWIKKVFEFKKVLSKNY
jgi:hypothetical protein